MTASYQELKNLQEQMRDTLREKYLWEYHSVRKLSMAIGIPYTTFRGFMIGNSISWMNLNKIHQWLNNKPA